MAGLISFMFAVAMVPWRAFVLLKLWVWFLVPVWPILAAPKWNLYGLSIIAAMLTGHIKREKEKATMEDWVYNALAAFIFPALSLLIGWTIKAICL